ncbi:hypothetical protein AVEN_81113-1 [Araneus ventricosus]|uniref:Uncharacterized protein n=1 Tax=Araneus ventricosus TaxID=182803 RepID=A0A4Y2DWG0_ARAVE|nr:hypothetical protein AVEN_81113-1 [Araneus ventricosus]
MGDLSPSRRIIFRFHGLPFQWISHRRKVLPSRVPKLMEWNRGECPVLEHACRFQSGMGCCACTQPASDARVFGRNELAEIHK